MPLRHVYRRFERRGHSPVDREKANESPEDERTIDKHLPASRFEPGEEAVARIFIDDRVFDTQSIDLQVAF